MITFLMTTRCCSYIRTHMWRTANASMLPDDLTWLTTQLWSGAGSAVVCLTCHILQHRQNLCFVSRQIGFCVIRATNSACPERLL